MQSVKELSSIQSYYEVKNKNDKLVELVQNPDQQRTLEDEQELLRLQQKGLEYIQSLPSNHVLKKEKLFINDDYTKMQLVALGAAIENKENAQQLKNTNIPEKQDLSNIQKQQEEMILILEQNIEKHGMQKNLSLKPDLTAKKDEKQDKNENDLEVEEQPELQTKPEEKVAILEEKITEELTIRAKRDGELKEVTLQNSQRSENGEIPRSVVVDLSTPKIEETINKLDEIYNPSTSKLAQSKKVENPAENIPKPPLNVSSTDNNSKNKVSTPAAFKPQAPKPTPKHQPQDNIKVQVENTQAAATANISATVAELSEKFRRKQELDPTVVEEEKFETVTPFDLKNKNSVMNRIMAIRQKSMHQPSPYATNPYGSQDVPQKKKLLSTSGI